MLKFKSMADNHSQAVFFRIYTVTDERLSSEQVLVPSLHMCYTELPLRAPASDGPDPSKTGNT